MKDSETKFILQLIWHTLATPFRFIMMFFGRRKLIHVFIPFIMVWKFITAAKLTFWLIVINILAFIFSSRLSEATLQLLINYPTDLLTMQWHTLVTAGFLHADIIHLLGNMLFLFIFGRAVEKELRAGKTFIVYFGALIISGIFSSLIHLFMLKDNVGGLGASGAIMGLVATAMLLKPFTFTYVFGIPLPMMLAAWMAILADITGIINPVEDGIGHFAHLGGFISMAVIMFFLSQEDKKHLKKGLLINIVTALGLAVVYYVVLRIL